MRDTALRRRDDSPWKLIAVLLIGLLVGGVPNYASLLYQQKNAITLQTVDLEIAEQQKIAIAPLSQKIDDLENQVRNLVRLVAARK